MSSAPPVALVVRDPSEPPAPWEAALDGMVKAAAATAPGAAAGAGCAFIDGRLGDAVERARGVHATDASLQSIIVAPDAVRPVLERSLLFTPGLGEIWIVPPDDVGAALLERAAALTRTRRSYRAMRSSVHVQVAAFERRAAGRTFISDAYLAALLEAAPEPIISIGAGDVVLSWNPGAERLLGYGVDEALGRPLTELLVLARPDQRLALAPASPPRPIELELVRRDGDVAVGELLVLPVQAAGQHVRAVMIRDLTRERRAQAAMEAQASELEAQAVEMEEQASELAATNDALHQRTQELESASNARARFYAAMSHELRTPLNAILGFQDLLLAELHGPLGDAQRAGLERAQRAARHLVELVNDVLDMAKIEAGRVELQVEPTSLPSLVDELLDTVEALARQHHTTITVEGTGTHRFRTDPRRVRQVLLNLLSNAIKFGESRPVRVAWRALPDGGACIDVIDQGRGIAPDDMERIFDEFTQVEAGGGSGTGLGLSISRRLTQLLGGTLSVESRLGAGSTFRLTLPAQPPS